MSVIASRTVSINHGKGEDPRYVAMRERDGERFWLTSLYRVFLVQG
jgi:steroid 5-alpha reductase family enzyme